MSSPPPPKKKKKKKWTTSLVGVTKNPNQYQIISKCTYGMVSEIIIISQLKFKWNSPFTVNSSFKPSEMCIFALSNLYQRKFNLSDVKVLHEWLCYCAWKLYLILHEVIWFEIRG